MSPASFPIEGIVGVATGHADLEHLPAGLGGVEVRADLFPSPEEAVAVVGRLAPEIPVLFTYRLAREGGEYRGGDADRLPVFRAALEAGAVLVDAEWRSDAARELAAERAPLLISHHDFDSMPDAETLAAWTRELEAREPAAIKVVPSAGCLEDNVRMLEWVARTPSAGPRRLGFAMGERGLASRVLSICRGAPFTYGSLGRSVAPGQVSAEQLRQLWRADQLPGDVRVLGVVGNPVGHSRSPHLHNPALEERGVNAVYLAFLVDSLDEFEPCWDALSIDGLSVTIPFKEAALERSDSADERSRLAGAANTLVRRDGESRAYNTDFDGVLGPLRACVPDLEGLRAAVLGNGGAAKGASRALLEVRADVRLYGRSRERGEPVARKLGIEWAPLGDLQADDAEVILNATPLGLHAGDASPIAAEVFRAETIAFDMVYEPRTQFLEDARAAGARCIHGREMLIAQGLVQFELFTGLPADEEIFAAGFEC